MLLCTALPGMGLTTPLNETQCLELALQRHDFRAWNQSPVEQARGDLTRARTWSNPELELSRENLDEETETDIWLRQRLDLSGRRALQQEAARFALDAARAHSADTRLERIAEVRRQFYQTLFQQRRQERFAAWLQAFEEVEAGMRKREASGDVSGYDRRRISRERISLDSRQRESAAAYRAARLQLMGLLELNDGQTFERLQGELIPAEPPSLQRVLQAVRAQPALQQLQHQASAKRASADALAKGRIPDLTLGLGHKRLELAGESASGMMLSASLSLPLFDHRQGEHQRALAELQGIESETRLTRSRLEAEARSLWQLTRDLARNARLFREQSLSASHELVRIARTAYRSNELGVLELIDAYRSALEADLDALQLALEARQRRIELERLSGEVLP